MVEREALNLYFHQQLFFLSPLLNNIAPFSTDFRFFHYHNKTALNYTHVLLINNSDHTTLIIIVLFSNRCQKKNHPF